MDLSRSRFFLSVYAAGLLFLNGIAHSAVQLPSTTTSAETEDCSGLLQECKSCDQLYNSLAGKKPDFGDYYHGAMWNGLYTSYRLDCPAVAIELLRHGANPNVGGSMGSMAYTLTWPRHEGENATINKEFGVILAVYGLNRTSPGFFGKNIDQLVSEGSILGPFGNEILGTLPKESVSKTSWPTSFAYALKQAGLQPALDGRFFDGPTVGDGARSESELQKGAHGYFFGTIYVVDSKNITVEVRVLGGFVYWKANINDLTTRFDAGPLAVGKAISGIGRFDHWDAYQTRDKHTRPLPVITLDYIDTYPTSLD